MKYILNFNTLYKFLFNKNFRKLKQEKNKLLNKARYISGSADILENKIEYVDAITCYSGYIEIFEKEPYKFKTDSQKPYIIDCGSNIGLSVIYLKQLYPNSKLMAFEPDPNIFKTLQNNIHSFKFNDITLYNAAVWTSNGSLNFQLEGGMSGRIPKGTDEDNLITVKSLRLKDFLNEHVDFLKIDIEGAEYEVLKDCADLLHNVDKLFIEYHSHLSEEQKLDEILHILTSKGFRYHIHDAYTVPSPFINNHDMIGMDLQLNIYAQRK